MNTAKPLAPRYDVIVVGARCAGAATALLLARSGVKVLLIDSGAPGTDTMSTHALMRGAVMQLSSWGLLDRIEGAGTPAIRRTAFVYGTEAIELAIKPSHGVDALYAPRRYVLDRVLAEAAAAAGADVRYGLACFDLLRGVDGRVCGIAAATAGGAEHRIWGDLVIGADGRGSAVAEFAGSRIERQSLNASAGIYGYFDGVEDRGNRWHFADGLAGGSIPTNDGQACIFVMMPPKRFLAEARGRMAAAFAPLVSVFPEIGSDLLRARQSGRLVGFAGQKGHMRQAAGNGWALVGDAGYFKDPITSHGITDALRDAEILARAIVGGDDLREAYQAQRDALSRDLFEVTDRIAGFAWSLDELKTLHLGLNQTMKLEQDWMAANFDTRREAA